MFFVAGFQYQTFVKNLELKPGHAHRFHSFTMGDWTADETVSVKDSCACTCTAHLWMCGEVEGTWADAARRS